MKKRTWGDDEPKGMASRELAMSMRIAGEFGTQLELWHVSTYGI